MSVTQVAVPPPPRLILPRASHLSADPQEPGVLRAGSSDGQSGLKPYRGKELRALRQRASLNVRESVLREAGTALEQAFTERSRGLIVLWGSLLPHFKREKLCPVKCQVL